MRSKRDYRSKQVGSRRWVVGVSVALSVSTASAQMEEATILAEGRITSDVLGYGLDYDGQTILAGAPFGTHSGHSQPGRAFTFAFVDGAWRQTSLLIPPRLESGAFFGNIVTVDGDRLAIAATGEDAGDENAGAVYLYERRDGVWEHTARLTSPAPRLNGAFGAGLALRGETLFVGAPGENDQAGKVYVFERESRQDWRLGEELTPDDGEAPDFFGVHVNVDGDRAAISAAFDDVDGVVDAGSVYIFEKTLEGWRQQAKLTADAPFAEAEFGHATSLRGNTLAVSAPEEGEEGAAYLFNRDDVEWNQAARLEPPDPQNSSGFGEDLSLDGPTLVVGAFLSTRENVGGAGKAYVYRQRRGEWTYDAEFAPQLLDRLSFAWRLTLRGDRAVVAAPFHTLNRGAVYVFNDLRRCAGKEKIASAKCRPNGETFKLVVKLKKGQAGDSYAATLLDGSSREGTLNGAGGAKTVFKNVAVGPGTVRVSWGCGAQNERDYECS